MEPVVRLPKNGLLRKMNIIINHIVCLANGMGSITGKTNQRLEVIRNGPITDQGNEDHINNDYLFV